MSSFCMLSTSSSKTEERSKRQNKRLFLKRRSKNQTELSKVSPIIHEVLRCSGRPLDQPVRAFMESHFGHDFSQVRVHTDARAAESAEAVNALAYTVGREIVFSLEHYKSGEVSGRRLLAHELAHVVQQNQERDHTDVERSADVAANLVAQGRMVSQESIGGAPFGLHRKDNDEEKKKKLKPPLTKPAFRLSPEELSKPLEYYKSFQFPMPSLAPKRGEKDTPESPSRLLSIGSGRFSLGLRLGFPKPEGEKLAGAPGTGIKESFRKGKLMKHILTGKTPTSLEAVGKGKLAKAIWGIFSTKIDPDLARDITRKLSTSAGPAGVSFELDLAILTEYGPGGLSFIVRY